MPIQTGKDTTCALLEIRIDMVLGLGNRYSHFTEQLFNFTSRVGEAANNRRRGSFLTVVCSFLDDLL